MTLDGSVIFASPACRLLSADVQGLDGRSLASLAHPDDSARVGGRTDVNYLVCALKP